MAATKFWNGAAFEKIAIICCLMRQVDAMGRMYEEPLAKYYKKWGTIKWKYDPNVFCESLVLEDAPSVTFQDAKITTESLTLEWLGCTVIEVEVLECHYTGEGKRKYYSGQDRYTCGTGDRIFRVKTNGRNSKCDAGVHRHTLGYEVLIGIRKPLVQRSNFLNTLRSSMRPLRAIATH